MRAALFAAVFSVGAQAAAFDCSNPQSGPEITHCAGLAYEAADLTLNEAYRLAVDAARLRDAESDGSWDISAETLLREAQRAWIPFRDAACSAESTLYRGGTGQTMLYLNCLERVTETRTYDLLYFAEADR
ncbi:MAG: lysozyme inhibitor LprI family protein [Pseudomonadota bacterium]